MTPHLSPTTKTRRRLPQSTTAYVTDAVLPPKDVTIKKTFVKWEDLTNLEILGWNDGGQTKG